MKSEHEKFLSSAKPERTGWRDAGLSGRHRLWGFKLPAVDLDFILCEFDKGKPTAIIEYKHELAKPQFSTHPSYIALSKLGDRAGLPVFVVRYSSVFEWFKVMPLNSIAKKVVPERITVDERTFVTWLYEIRGIQPPEEIFKALETAI
jgi:hypothetical protein